MTCPSCGFENMRGLVVCSRCGARLVWDGPTGRRHFLPPRAGKGILSRLSARARVGLRRLGVPRFLEALDFPGFWRKIPPPDGKVIILALLPGLGNILQGRLIVGGPWFALWLSLWYHWFYYSSESWSFVSAVVLVHMVSLVLFSKPLRFCRGVREWLIFLLTPAAALFALYSAVAMAVFPLKPAFVRYSHPRAYPTDRISPGSDPGIELDATRLQPRDLAIIEAESGLGGGKAAYVRAPDRRMTPAADFTRD